MILYLDGPKYRESPFLTDCVEKVGPSRPPAYWLLKTHFLLAAM